MNLTFRVLIWLVAPISLSITSVLLPISFSTQKNVLELIKLHGVAGSGDAVNPFLTALFFFCSGLLLGMIDRRFWFVSSVITIAVFPILVLTEVILDIGRHNVFPFEIAVYVILGLPTIGGAALGATLARFFERMRPPDTNE